MQDSVSVCADNQGQLCASYLGTCININPSVFLHYFESTVIFLVLGLLPRLTSLHGLMAR